jgi:HAD superfamily hydrolase (TIGR01549 family)
MRANSVVLRRAQKSTGVAYQAWLVDLDGTLYRQFWVRMAMAGELLVRGRSAIPLLRKFRRAQEELRRGAEIIEGAADPFQLQIRRTAEQLGLEGAHVERVVVDWMIERPALWLGLFRRRGLLAEIERFHKEGGKTALVSDYPATAKLRALGAEDLFDEIVASGEPDGPKRLKPCPDGFLLAAQRLGVLPAECLVLGDRDDADGEAARRAGMAFRKIGGFFASR